MARSSINGGKGNRPHDEDFLQWMEHNGGLEVISPEDEDIPFPAKTRWRSETDDESPWIVPPPGRRCVGKAFIRDADGDYVVDANNERLMRPCWSWPMRGMTVCLRHGGGIARVRKAAVERLATSLDAATGELVRLALAARDEKVRLGAITAMMDRLGVKAGVDINHMQDPEYLEILRDIMTRGGASEGESDD